MIITNWEKFLIDIICLQPIFTSFIGTGLCPQKSAPHCWCILGRNLWVCGKNVRFIFSNYCFFLQLIKLFWSYICIFRLEWCAWPYNVHVYYTLIALWLYGLKRVNKIFDPLTKVKSLLGCGFWFELCFFYRTVKCYMKMKHSSKDSSQPCWHQRYIL